MIRLPKDSYHLPLMLHVYIDESDQSCKVRNSVSKSWLENQKNQCGSKLVQMHNTQKRIFNACALRWQCNTEKIPGAIETTFVSSKPQ